MKASFYVGNRKFEIQEIPVPVIEPEDVLIKMLACGVCGTDVHKAIHGTVAPPIVLGHEVSGIVVEVGNAVSKFSVGDHVAVAHHAPCMVCSACLKNHHSLCSQYLQTNIIPGGFSEYIRLPRDNVQKTVYKIPHTLNLEDAAFMEPLACCLRGFECGNFHAGDNVLILGAGPIGLLHLQIAQVMNAGWVGLTDLNTWRLEKALELGASAVYNAHEDISTLIVKDLGLPQIDLIIVCVGVKSAYSTALNLVGTGGTIIFFSEVPSGSELLLDPNLIYKKEVTIVGSYSSSPPFLAKAIRLIQNQKIQPSHLVTHRFPLDQVQEAIELAHQAGQSLKTMISPFMCDSKKK
ncbi:MAG: alcohol dehydrogenase catalytic domain-containing protein [Candidatus Hodarchaeota archaeon]